MCAGVCTVTVVHCPCLALQVLAQETSDFPLPDLAQVAEHSDPVELGRLVQLVLGCAVRCERKQGARWLGFMSSSCAQSK